MAALFIYIFHPVFMRIYKAVNFGFVCLQHEIMNEVILGKKYKLWSFSKILVWIPI